MPKTWNDGPPRSNKDGWQLALRCGAYSIATNVAGFMIMTREDDFEFDDELLDYAVDIASRIQAKILKAIPRVDGGDWDGVAENEEDSWSLERGGELTSATVLFVCRSMTRDQRASWNERPEVSDDLIDRGIQFALKLTKAADRAYPRLG